MPHKLLAKINGGLEVVFIAAQRKGPGHKSGRTRAAGGRVGRANQALVFRLQQIFPRLRHVLHHVRVDDHGWDASEGGHPTAVRGLQAGGKVAGFRRQIWRDHAALLGHRPIKQADVGHHRRRVVLLGVEFGDFFQRGHIGVNAIERIQAVLGGELLKHLAIISPIIRHAIGLEIFGLFNGPGCVSRQRPRVGAGCRRAG